MKARKTDAQHKTMSTSNSQTDLKADLICKCKSRCTAKKSCPCKKAGQLCSSRCHPMNDCANKISFDPNLTSSCVIPDSSYVPSSSSQPLIWKKQDGIELTTTDKQVISSGKWLNDNVISAWQRMLAKKFPEIGGLEDTIKQNAASFSANKGKFVQVMNLGGCHWVAVSNVGCDEDVINWMDSLHGLPISTVKREVADILHSPLPVVTVQCLNVQKQRSGSDCGLFALAFIIAVCHGDDPTSLYFDQENMCFHLITNIESGEATPFPVIKKQTRRKRLVDTVHIELHCVCRLPDNGTPMIKCDECQCWFHAVCVNAVLGEKPWFCQTCSTN